MGVGLTGVAVLVSKTDICIPSMIYNALFGGLELIKSRDGKTIMASLPPELQPLLI